MFFPLPSFAPPWIGPTTVLLLHRGTLLLAGGFVLLLLLLLLLFELWEPSDGVEGDGLQQPSLSVEQLPPVTELQRLHEKYVHDGDGSG